DETILVIVHSSTLQMGHIEGELGLRVGEYLDNLIEQHIAGVQRHSTARFEKSQCLVEAVTILRDAKREMVQLGHETHGKRFFCGTNQQIEPPKCRQLFQCLEDA